MAHPDSAGGWMDLRPFMIIEDYCVLTTTQPSRFWPIRYTSQGVNYTAHIDVISRITVKRKTIVETVKPTHVVFRIDDLYACDMVKSCKKRIPIYDSSKRNGYLLTLANIDICSLICALITSLQCTISHRDDRKVD